MNEKLDVEGQIGVLSAVADDIRQGHLLQTIRMLVAADLLANFMEQAAHLLAAGYQFSAASLCGAVLESSLREFAATNGISVREREDISSLNTQACTRLFNASK
jgi:hypothetical protein